MKLIGVIVVIVIAIIGIVLGLIAYSYTQIHVSLNDVTFHSIDWESMSWSTLLKLGLNVLTGNWLGAAFSLIQGINLNLIFGLDNYGILPVYIPDLSYDLSINDVPVGHGYGKIDTIINPGETKEIKILQNFQKNSLAPAIESIVGTDGIIDLRVSGTAYFKLLGIDIPVPFESSKQISIKDEIETHLNDEIQKNQEESGKALSHSMGESLDNAFKSIKNTVNGVMNTLNQIEGQKVDPNSKYETPTQTNTERPIRQLGDVHVHGAILVKIFGDEFNFASPHYQVKSPYIHFENGDGNTIHRHATKTTIDELFDSLEMRLTADCFVFPDKSPNHTFCTNDDYTLKFYVNHQPYQSIQNYVINDNDRILISYGNDNKYQLQKQINELDSIPINK